MARSSSPSPETPAFAGTAGLLPEVRIVVQQPGARPATYALADASFLIGTVPGCDLRLPGSSLPSVLCLITRQPGRVWFRKLSPVQAVLLNGRPIPGAPLNDGDQITLGPVQVQVQVSDIPAAPAADLAALDELDARQRQLQEQTRELETDRIIWYRRRDEIERECRQRQETSHLFFQQVRQQERDVEIARADLEQREEALRQQREEVDRGQKQVEAVRDELAALRRQWHERYQARRDRLAGLREAIRAAGRKVQERKREVDAEVEQAALRRQEDEAQRAELDARTAELARERQGIEQREREVEARLTDCQAREQRLAEDRRALEHGLAQHQADLVRLDRRQAALEQREQEVQAQGTALEQRLDQLQQDGRELEEQATRLDEWHTWLTGEADQLAEKKAAHETASAQLARRSAVLEGQQAMLASLRTRLERMREEIQREAQELAEQRTRLEAAEAELEQRTAEAQRLRGAIDDDRLLHEQERCRSEERQAALDQSVAQLRQLQDRLAAQEAEVQQREQALAATAAEQAEQASLLRARSDQLIEQQKRLDAERQALRERETGLAQAEEALASLQEQLRRRSEELNARHQDQASKVQRHQEEAARFEAQAAALQADVEARSAELAARRDELEARRDEVETLRAAVTRREEELAHRVERLKEAGRNLGRQRKALAGRRVLTEAEQQAAEEATRRARTELDALRLEAAELAGRLPHLELKAQEAADRLTQAREQLRGHLAEFHAFVGQSRGDLEGLQAEVRAEAEHVRQQELGLRRAREEHRLAVAGYRQQLVEWQGQVAELKQGLARDETRLERRQAEVDEQARQIGATSARLARQAEELQEQERQVASRREEVTRHLEDMRQWYRHKLRELSGVSASPAAADSPGEPSGAAADGPRAGEPDILPLTGEVEPGDRQLGELLRSLDLVDADTLAALLVEARKQRRSLRQALLANGSLTLYQMALIEAGNLDGLVMGPVRVIDRLGSNARESAYRVFDPRRGHEALLRHLAEAEMQDAVRPDEFRQRFAAAAAVSDPHLAAVLEVLEIGGRPAALVEWPAGLPSTDWPAQAAVPAVWHRLLSQAAQGLHAAHQSGLVHGHLTASHVLLTPDGVVKLYGFGEPAWLVAPLVPEPQPGDAAADLFALGHVARCWAEVSPPRKSARTRAMPEALQAVLRRLTAEDPEMRYAGAAELLEDLERAVADLPAGGTAWERLLRYVRQQMGKDEGLRQSA